MKKKAILPVKKTLWPIFSRIIECDKPQETIFKGPQAILTITVELRTYRSIFLGTDRLLKTQFFEKKAKFPVKKTLWPNFSRIIERDKHQWTICKGPKGFLVITVELIREFFKDLSVC